jgi:hypothetical protein
MEKQNVAKPGITPCSYCGRPSDTVVEGKAACKLHIKLVKQASAQPPLKDASSSLEKEWADK